jgi:hypothetical protein
LNVVKAGIVRFLTFGPAEKEALGSESCSEFHGSAGGRPGLMVKHGIKAGGTLD